MYIVVVGLSHKTAPVEIREKFSFRSSELGEAMKALQNKNKIVENVILSTCNRTEIYAVMDELEEGKIQLLEFLSEWFQMDKNEFLPYLFFYIQELAIKHLFKVTCGLTSKILGETQILGQVRTSFLLAQQEKTTGSVFNHSFKKAVTLGKRAHTETDIGTRAVSIGYVAVELLKNLSKPIHDLSILVIGAGEMAELLLKNIKSNGANKITLMSRALDKAKAVAKRYLAEVVPIEDLQIKISESDIIISAASAGRFIITKDMIHSSKSLLFLDLSVPRSIDPTIKERDQITLYNIDNLNDIMSTNLLERKKAAKKIMSLIEGEMDEFNNWVNLLDVVPVMTAMNYKVSTIKKEAIDSIYRKLPNLSDHDKKVITKHIDSIGNQMLREPLSYIKKIAGSDSLDKELNVIRQVFNIDLPVQKNCGEHNSL
ncbi:glutamyl-tRNA reductase [Cytobacillus sp. FSL H8-0458]|uniref:glutamyl-tRNA reductase n=1 Tax=Cytobacillus sp. FSL H8-0458 TaxID=2975346 RepID=UPI0030FB547F